MTPRYEYKIPCSLADLPEIECWIRLHPAHWRRSYLSRQVNNIYFDSYNLHDLNANLTSAGVRKKVRLRWYGPDIAWVRNAHLERKCKEGLAGWKEAVAFPGSLDLTQGLWPAHLNTLCTGSNPQIRLWLHDRSQPALINAYRRAYYETPDGTLRLTIDTGLRAYDQRLSMAPNLTRPASQPDIVVLELKAPVVDESARRLSQVLATLPHRIDRFSKYLHGLLASPDLEGLQP